MSRAFERASFAMIAIGVIGIVVGVFEAIYAYTLAGVVVALVSAGAASLAVVKLQRQRARSTRA